MTTKAAQILAALGGRDNVLEVEPCVTRLRTEVRDPGRVDRMALRRAGCHGVMVYGPVVQVVVGPQADVVASEIAELACGDGLTIGAGQGVI